MAETLDLSQLIEERPTVRLPDGDFKMRRPEELTFTQFGRQTAIGKTLIEQAEHVGEEGVLDQLQQLVIEAAQILLVDFPDDIAATVTPGMYLSISRFFSRLANANEAEASESGSSSAPGVSDSTDRPAEAAA